MAAMVLILSLHLLLLFVFFTQLSTATNQQGFWSIDCGAASGHVDANNITWEGDAAYVRGGETRTVTGMAAALGASLRTFRVFPSPSPAKNCYTVPVGKGVRVLVRARFGYGNYDGLANPPFFFLLLDTQYWAVVVTTMNGAIWEEAVYMTQASTTSVCVARVSPDMHPFISSLEVRTLPTKAYADADAPFLPRSHAVLSTQRRVAFGAAAPFQYPYDAYDRVWYPLTVRLERFNYTTLRNDAALTTPLDTSWMPDVPPPKLFEAAAAPLKGRNLSIGVPYLSDVQSERTTRVSFYFTEVSKVNNGSRTFDMYMDGDLLTGKSGTIMPLSGEPLEMLGVLSNVTNATVFTLVPAGGSTLPPVISGVEVTRVSEAVTNRTFSGDVDALASLQAGFDAALGNWTGDPCLPDLYHWEWIECSSHKDPARVTKLLLGGYNLTGDIPNFGALDNLQTIDLHDNSLGGTVPEFFDSFSNLTLLDLSGNDFDNVPHSILMNKNLYLNYTDNPKLCKSGGLCIMKPGQDPPPELISGNTTESSPPSSSAPSTPPATPLPTPTKNGSLRLSCLPITLLQFICLVVSVLLNNFEVPSTLV